MCRLAWLNAELDGDVKGRRSELLKDGNPLKKLPEITTAPYLIEYSLEVGLFKHGGMGLTPLDWVDIQAWIKLTGLEVHPEEIKILKALSASYIIQLNKSKKSDCPAPFLEEVTPTQKCINIKEQMAQFRRKLKK